jgi:hypothetical protein
MQQEPDDILCALLVSKAVPPAFKGDFPGAQAPAQGKPSAPVFALTILPARFHSIFIPPYIPALIATDQHPLGISGRRIRRDSESEVFARRLADGGVVVLLNRGKEPAEMRVTAGELGSSKNALEVRDLWTGQKWSITDGIISARVEGRGVAMLRVTTGTASKPANDCALQLFSQQTKAMRLGPS